MSGGGIAASLARRFADPAKLPRALADNETLARMARRGSCRRFRGDPPDLELLRALAAIALGAPSKSDLQQRDIVIIRNPRLMVRIKALLGAQVWIAEAPALLVFLANNRRQRQLHAWWKRPFANDHLDAFFNASVDAAIALASFVHAAEAAGLGCCPISTIRNVAGEVSGLLDLPDHVFPVAALAVGYPHDPVPRISMRLPLAVTVHTDRFSDTGLREAVESYDNARAARQPGGAQRQVETFGNAEPYTWSDDKTRQYSRPERRGFGAYIRKQGFVLD